MFDGMNGLEILKKWPRFEDGEPVRIGEDVDTRRGICTIKSVRLYDGSFTLYGEDKHGLFEVCHISWQDGERVRRPAVLAADGEPIEVGQTVWDTNGDELVIGALEDGGHTVACRYVDVGDGIPVHGMWSPSDLTHQRPVLDADGALTREGDEVWSTTGEFDGKRTVSSVHIDPDEPPYAMFEERQKPYSCLCCYLTHQRPVFDADGVPIHEGDTVWRVNGDGPFTATEYRKPWMRAKAKDGRETGFWPDDLTHTKPEIDTWQRVEEDAEKDPCDYFGFDGEETCGKCPASGKNCEQTMALDIVRRAKALAERERGE